MAALDSHEQEQIDALKAWWNDNGNMVLGIILVAVTALGGWRGWQYYQNKQAGEAATLYAQFAGQIGSGDAKRVNDAAEAVMERYAATAYAPRAALQAARINEQGQVDGQGGDAAKAKTQLQWVIDHAEEPALKDVARLRLAAILLDENKFDEAMKLLETKHPASFDVLYADLKGDVLSAQGKIEEARSAYKLAHEKLAADSPYRNLIQMKLDVLEPAK